MKELTERKLPTPGSNPDIMEEQVKDAFVWAADILLLEKEELAVDIERICSRMIYTVYILLILRGYAIIEG